MNTGDNISWTRTYDFSTKGISNYRTKVFLQTVNQTARNLRTSPLLYVFVHIGSIQSAQSTALQVVSAAKKYRTRVQNIK